ncbi:MAG: hypothetical protein JNJ61_09075 [Anaerolineae bacterium]|nr:hypothetical protein [Anaerolineae bacterium]
MSAKSYWDDPAQTVIRIDYEGNWTWEEYFAAADDGRDLASSVTHRVDYILDFRNGTQPKAGSVMSNARNVLLKRAPNSGVFVTVSTPFAQVMLNVFKSFDRKLSALIYGATSIEEAHAILAKVRQQEAERTPQT